MPFCSCKIGTYSNKIPVSVVKKHYIYYFFFLISHLAASHLQRWTAKRGGEEYTTELENIHKRSLNFLKVMLFWKTVCKKNFTIFIMPPRFWISNGGHAALEQIEMKSVSSPAILCCWVDFFFFHCLSLFLYHFDTQSILMRALHVVSLGLGNCGCTMNSVTTFHYWIAGPICDPLWISCVYVKCHISQ